MPCHGESTGGGGGPGGAEPGAGATGSAYRRIGGLRKEPVDAGGSGMEKVTFNRVALHDGKLADVNKDVQIQPATE